MKIGSKFTTGILSKLIAMLIRKKFGYDVDLKLNEVNATVIDGKTQVPLLVKDIPIDTMRLTLNPEDTKDFDFGKYVYDIQLTKEDGTVDTFITKTTIKITEEVD